MEKEKKDSIENRLKTVRHELIEKRERLEESRMNLKQDQVEFEERAASQQLASGQEQLDDRTEEKVAAINHALERLQAGEYTHCASCGESISEKRLETLPWTSLCIDCAEKEEQQQQRAAASEAGEAETVPTASSELPEELRGLNDEQLISAVTDTIIRDGEVPLDDLLISCSEGHLRLEGALPDKRQLSRLQQLVYDVLGFTEVEESIRVDRIAWARRDRSPGIAVEKEEKPDHTDGSGTQTIDAVKEGKTMNPADEVIPEKHGRKP